MAYDKVVDAKQLDADLTAVANAIRTKGETGEALVFPGGFISAIQAIETGGGKSGVDIVITSTVTNVKQLMSILADEFGSNKFLFDIKMCKNGMPIQNQICYGCYLSPNIGGVVRYRDGVYGTAQITETYDAAVTIGDIYTLYEVHTV